MNFLDLVFFGLFAICAFLSLLPPKRPRDGIGMKLTRTKCFDWPERPV